MSYPRPYPMALGAAAMAVLLTTGAADARPARQGRAPSAAPAATVSPAVTPSPFLGEWELDLTRMPATYGPPPKRVVYTFDDIGSGLWRTTIDITAPNDSVRHVAIAYRRDGRPARNEGDTDDGDSAALISPAPDVLVMSIAKEKQLASVRTYTISADGKEMTEAAADVDAAGVPYVRNFHFRRIG